MRELDGKAIVALLEGVVHAETQVDKFCVDLTVAQIHRFTKRGTLDFGGGECLGASTKALHPKKKGEDDKYGWWELHQGLYLLVYNEKFRNIDERHLATLSPHPRLLQAGAYHATSSVFVSESFTSVLHVSQVGCALKENCRVSRLQIWERSSS